jgi:hypothetical protein
MNSSKLIFWHVNFSFERVEVWSFICILMMLKYVFFFTTKYCQSIPHTFSEYSANRCLCYRKTSTIDCWLSTFPIANILYICISIPEAPSYGDYITQMEGYSRTCSSYHDVVNRGYLVTRKLLNQWYIPSL